MRPEKAEDGASGRMASASLRLERERFGLRDVMSKARAEAMRAAGNVALEQREREAFAEEMIERVARLEVAGMAGPRWRVPAGLWQWVKDALYDGLRRAPGRWTTRLAGWVEERWPVSYEVYEAMALLPAVPLPENVRWPVTGAVLEREPKDGWRAQKEAIDYRDLREHTREDGQRQAWVDRLLHYAAPEQKAELWEELHRAAAGEPVDWNRVARARQEVLLPVWELLGEMERKRQRGEL